MQQQQQEAKISGSSGGKEIVQEVRPALKFGFASKPVPSKVGIPCAFVTECSNHSTLLKCAEGQIIQLLEPLLFLGWVTICL